MRASLLAPLGAFALLVAASSPASAIASTAVRTTAWQPGSPVTSEAPPAAQAVDDASQLPVDPDAVDSTAGEDPEQDSSASPPASSTGDLAREVDSFREGTPWFGIPALMASAPPGRRVIAAGDTVHGPAAARDGTLEIHGTVLGDAVAYGGDVVLYPGSTVAGDAIAVLGRVRLLGGIVGGEVRSVRGSLVSAPIGAAPQATVRERLGLVVGWLTVLVLIGVGVLVFANRPLEGVVDTLYGGFFSSLLLGLAGQLALLPAIVVLVVGLAVTLIGILLIPFAIVAVTLATAGLMMLGFLAVAQVTGGALSVRRRGRELSGRGLALRSLVVGIVLFISVWLLAAIATPFPMAAAVLHGIALTLTWVAVTAGFGAALRSRAGTRRAPVPPMPTEEPEEELSWQTPTPIGGVVAARRPQSTPR